MKSKPPPLAVRLGFERTAKTIAIDSLVPLREVGERTKKSAKYAKIETSIREIGLVEFPVIARDPTASDRYLLLDGHLRVEVLKGLGRTDVECLIATDDEAFTYNKRISRLAMVQEHKMILKTIERGVRPERIAQALNIDVKTLQQRMRLLNGICREAADLLRDRQVPINTFWVLKKMQPIRQIEVAELMIATNKFSINYARAILAATPENQLVNAKRPKFLSRLPDDQITIMRREAANLEQEFRASEQAYGKDHLDLVLAKGYLNKLLSNAKVVRYLAQHHKELLAEFQKIAELRSSAA